MFILIFISNIVLADNHNLNEVLKLIQQDLKTLEKAVYSGSINTDNLNIQNSFDKNSEDVLTRHLLKLSEIESQFKVLTNQFEEINFKLDKLSSRMSKVQADNQVRFQDIENTFSTGGVNKKLSSKSKKKPKKILPGSSQPQDLGSVTYKDTEGDETSQKIQSIETTSSIVTETFGTEQNILPNEAPEKQYEFATSFLRVGDYNTAERAFREFVLINSQHKLAGNAQYWYAETLEYDNSIQMQLLLTLRDTRSTQKVRRLL